MPRAVYADLCPVCGGDLSTWEVERGVCRRRRGEIGYVEGRRRAEEFFEFFEKCLGKRPRAIQRMWARRVLDGYSFSAIAPTGIGKSVFGTVMALYLATKGRRSYMVLPTLPLVKQTLERLAAYMERAGVEVEVATYHSGMKKREKEEARDRIARGDFDVLVTSAQFLSRNFHLLRGRTFHFIFVDDLDAVLRGSKNLEKILRLLGFTREEIADGKRRGGRRGVLMVSTATGRKGANTRLLASLLDFDVGSASGAVRNILDVYAGEKDVENLKALLREMGTGALIFAPSAEEARSLVDSLQGMKVSIATGAGPEVEAFREGAVDYLVGVAAPYGVLVRGIDMPRRIRYAVFWGVPRFEIRFQDVDSLPDGMLRALASALRHASPVLREFLEGKGDRNTAAAEIKRLLDGGAEPRGMAVRDGRVIIPDVRTYIQASGRTSRLYAGGITRGASFVFDGEAEARALSERLRFYDASLVPLEEVDLEALREEIDEDRRRIASSVEERDIVEPVLLVVESPNKARQIARFFGRPNVRVFGEALTYEISIGGRVVVVVPTLGHLVDLVTDRGFHGVEVNGRFVPIYSYIRRCRACGHQFTEGSVCPRCSSTDIYSAGNQVALLRRLAYETETVLVGTDPDTEGEKIAWDVINLVRGYAERVRRVEFHEVTSRAVLKAMEEPRDVDEKLVEAQMVRRVEDRWIGFELSRRLWEKFGNRNLSAGRAQTPVLGWVIERAKESRETVEFSMVEEWDLAVEGAFEEIAVEDVAEEEVALEPPPPYSTSALLEDAFRRLGLGAQETMRIAQELFEAGLITYHRTDSTRVGDGGFNVARAYLGEDFVPRRWGRGGAHECIRPTRAIDARELYSYMKEGLTSGIGEEHVRLYDLIFRRFMSSQSPPARCIRQRVLLSTGTEDERVIHVEGGFFRIYPEGVRVKPPLRKGMRAVPKVVKRRKTAPHTQATLISTMKERGIGRPSTYAVIVGKLFQRRYAYERKGHVYPTPLGVKVHRYLTRRYGKFVSEETTRALEERMNMVERGEARMDDVLGEIYREVMAIRGGKE